MRHHPVSAILLVGLFAACSPPPASEQLYIQDDLDSNLFAGKQDRLEVPYVRGAAVTLYVNSSGTGDADFSDWTLRSSDEDVFEVLEVRATSDDFDVEGLATGAGEAELEVVEEVRQIIEAIGNDIHPYFGDYGDEMVGAAAALGLKPGDIVMLNLAYQLEYLGLNCSNWNNTGPTVPDDPGCVDVDPKQDWCYCQALQRRGYDVADERTMLPPADGWRQGRRGAGGSGSGSSGGRDGSSYVSGPCTSVVAEDAHGSIWHGRNLDWNLPPVLRSLVVDLDYQRGNETVFTGTTFVGFSGVMSGIRAGGWSASIDARGKGGKLSKNLLQALLQHSATPRSTYGKR